MASPAGSIANTVQVPSAESTNVGTNQSSRGGYRNRNRNRNQGANRIANQGRQSLEASTSQQSRGRSNRPRGRGDFGMHRISQQDRNDSRIVDSPTQPGPQLDPPPAPGGGGTFGVRLTKDAITTEGELRVKDQTQGGEDEEAEVCFICASPVVHTSVAPCNHRTCHICALRLRALYKTRACAHCRVSLTPCRVYYRGSSKFI